MADYEHAIEQVLACLPRASGRPPTSRPVPWAAWDRLRDRVLEGFVIPRTTFSTAMCRLLFALGLMAPPVTLVGVGTFVGYGFAWLLRDRADPATGPHWARSLAIDVDPRGNETARENLSLLGHGPRLQVIDGAGASVLHQLPFPIGLLLIDLDDPATGKMGYAEVLEAAVPKLLPGALVLAHDCAVPRFAPAFATYVDAISRSGRFTFSAPLEVDECGLHLALNQ